MYNAPSELTLLCFSVHYLYLKLIIVKCKSKSDSILFNKCKLFILWYAKTKINRLQNLWSSCEIIKECIWASVQTNKTEYFMVKMTLELNTIIMACKKHTVKTSFLTFISLLVTTNLSSEYSIKIAVIFLKEPYCNIKSSLSTMAIQLSVLKLLILFF